MTRKLILTGAVVALCAVTGLAQNKESTMNDLAIVKDGKPMASIIVAAEPTSSAALAAEELRSFVKKITGAELPLVTDTAKADGIKIYVGENPDLEKLGVATADFRTQEYVVKILPDTIILAGKDSDKRGKLAYDLDDPLKMSGLPDRWDSNGTLYAVYDFLEKYCGVRFFNQTEFGTVLPETKTLRVKTGDIRRRPAFSYRDVPGGGIGDNPSASRYDSYVGLWNDGKELAEWDAMAYPSLHKKYPNQAQYEGAGRNILRLYLLRNRAGGDINRCNHSFYGFYDRFWAKNPKCPDKFVEKRVDYFAKGYDASAIPPQLCYTDEGLVKQIAQDAAEYYDGKKTGVELGIFWNPRLPNLFPVEPMDNSAFCKCPKCQALIKEGKGEDSYYFFKFVDAVAKELKKTHPDRKIMALAYGSHARLPSFQLDPSVAVQYCMTSNRSPFGEYYESQLKELQVWAKEKKESGRDFYMWLYYCWPVETAQNGKYHCFPGFFAHAIGDQMKKFHEYGVEGFFHCGYGQEVEAYVTFRLMDDPSLDVDQLLEEYFRQLYGKAADPMKLMYLEMEKTYCDQALRPKERLSGPELNWGCLGTPERMEKWGGLLAEADKSADTDAVKQRLALFRKGTWDYMTAGLNRYLIRKKTPIPTVRAMEIPAAGGIPEKADWTKAAELGGTWFDRGGGNPSARKFSGKVCHDDKYLYLEVTDNCDSGKLVTSSDVYPFDDWEVFIARQRALPYRQYAVSPSANLKASSHGEVNWRMNVPMDDTRVKAVSDRSRPDAWTVRMAFPLDSMLSEKVGKGDKIYMNILRVSSPEITGSGFGIDTWVAFCTVHETDRLGEIVLE